MMRTRITFDGGPAVTAELSRTISDDEDRVLVYLGESVVLDLQETAADALADALVDALAGPVVT